MVGDGAVDVVEPDGVVVDEPAGHRSDEVESGVRDVSPTKAAVTPVEFVQFDGGVPTPETNWTAAHRNGTLEVATREILLDTEGRPQCLLLRQ